MWIFDLMSMVFWIANIFLCYRLAKKKKRRSPHWGMLALIFGLLATLVLAALPVSDGKPTPLCET